MGSKGGLTVNYSKYARFQAKRKTTFEYERLASERSELVTGQRLNAFVGMATVAVLTLNFENRYSSTSE